MAYKGNIDNQFRMKHESELSNYWVELVKDSWDEDLKVVKRKTLIQAYCPEDWQKMERMEQTHGRTWLHITGFTEFRLLHDPSLPIKDLEIQ
jgi:hypothetical protein